MDVRRPDEENIIRKERGPKLRLRWWFKRWPVRRVLRIASFSPLKAAAAQIELSDYHGYSGTHRDHNGCGYHARVLKAERPAAFQRGSEARNPECWAWLLSPLAVQISSTRICG